MHFFFPFVSRSDQQTADCCSSVCHLCTGWIRIWVHWYRTDDRQFGFWVPSATWSNVRSHHRFGRDLLPRQET